MESAGKSRGGSHNRVGVTVASEPSQGWAKWTLRVEPIKSATVCARGQILSEEVDEHLAIPLKINGTD